ncbi:MAG TPA: lipase maturation factor family protein [Vicinamibacterales bacterium]|nr:lipase maturation factor family protein [Vicinamibacterales bacterium]
MAGDDERAGKITRAIASLTRVADWFVREDPARPGHWLGRFLVLRLLGIVYLMAFLTLVNQGPGLIGSHGLLPARDFMDAAAQELGGRAAGFWKMPTLFWLGASDGAIAAVGWLGVALSLVVIAGYANAILLAVLCALQISVIDIGQDFYAFGWEIQLVETGFLCIFLCPLLDGRPFPRRPPPAAVVWLLRWLIVRVMWGAGLIKLRGDPCWRDLTCLDFHFETQPVPSPLTPFFHFLPGGAHKLGVLFNHVVELAAPFLILTPWRRARFVGGALMAALQIVLIASGNLAFLNWLTLIPILACFDDGLWRRVLPRAIVARAEQARAAAVPSRAQGSITAVLTVAIALLSVPVVVNILSNKQLMNTSFTRLPLVNTYGAFGSVGREREQLVFEGTTDDEIGPSTKWRPYEFKCQPGDPARRPCWMSPYHYRLDWLLWFAAMGSPRDYPWAVHLSWKLLEAEPATLKLIARDPFGGAPPRFIRVERFRYRFAPRGAPTWWTRERFDTWLPPVSLDNVELQIYLRRQGWLR